MIGINFEKSNRAKNKEQNYISEEVVEHYAPPYLTDLENATKKDRLPERSIRPAGYYRDDDRLNTEEEIRKIRLLPPGTEKSEAFLELKEHFLRQQTGLSILKEQLFKEITSSTDSINQEKINQIITETDKEYHYSQEQIRTIEKMVNEFVTKNQLVAHFCDSNFNNPVQIFKKLFKAEPCGEVELSKGPISLAIICHDINDYARMYYNDYSGKKNLNEEEIKHANASGGFYSPAYPYGYYELKGVVIGINFKNNYSIENVIMHEEQHAINRIYRNHIHSDRQLSSNFYFCDTKEEMESVIRSYCEYLVYTASERIKDEILAYKTAPNNDSLILGCLTETKRNGGLYDYFDFNKTLELIRYKVQNGEEEMPTEELLRVAKEILRGKYRKLIEQGLKAVNRLNSKNYSHTQITALLMPHALDKWPKIAERMDFYNSENKPENQIQNIIADHTVGKIKNKY